jgi:hypothetical protein
VIRVFRRRRQVRKSLTKPQVDYEFAGCAHFAISAHRSCHRVQRRSIGSGVQ